MKKRVIKKIRMKERVKTILIIGLVQLALYGMVTIYQNRVEAIENGDMIQVNQNMMDR